jgi:hypothetical protein
MTFIDFPLPEVDAGKQLAVAVIGTGALGRAVADGLPDEAEPDLAFVVCDDRDPDALIEAIRCAKEAARTGRLTLGLVSGGANAMARWTDRRDQLRTGFRESVDTLLLASAAADDVVDVMRTGIIHCTRMVTERGIVCIDVVDVACVLGGPGRIGLLCTGDLDADDTMQPLVDGAMTTSAQVDGADPHVVQIVELDATMRVNDLVAVLESTPWGIEPDNTMSGDVRTVGLGQRRRMSIFTSWALPAPAH